MNIPLSSFISFLIHDFVYDAVYSFFLSSHFCLSEGKGVAFSRFNKVRHLV